MSKLVSQLVRVSFFISESSLSGSCFNSFNVGSPSQSCVQCSIKVGVSAWGTCRSASLRRILSLDVDRENSFETASVLLRWILLLSAHLQTMLMVACIVWTTVAVLSSHDQICEVIGMQGVGNVLWHSCYGAIDVHKKKCLFN